MSGFLLNGLLTAALIGIPTLVIWLWSGRRKSISESYYSALGTLAKWFGRVFAAIAGLIGMFALADLLSLTHFGYPGWTILMCIGFVAIGIGISIVADKFLSRARNRV